MTNNNNNNNNEKYNNNNDNNNNNNNNNNNKTIKIYIFSLPAYIPPLLRLKNVLNEMTSFLERFGSFF